MLRLAPCSFLLLRVQTPTVRPCNVNVHMTPSSIRPAQHAHAQTSACIESMAWSSGVRRALTCGLLSRALTLVEESGVVIVIKRCMFKQVCSTYDQKRLMCVSETRATLPADGQRKRTKRRNVESGGWSLSLSTWNMHNEDEQGLWLQPVCGGGGGDGRVVRPTRRKENRGEME